MVAFASVISAKTGIGLNKVTAVLDMLTEGATIPFIARYRKDSTGGLDEVQVLQIQEEAKFQKEFADRKSFIEQSVIAQGKMTEALQEKINKATSLLELEDIYLPYKTKRKTKAQTARENGLEPLAIAILKQEAAITDEVGKYLNDTVTSEEEAIQGARDIIAETINEDAAIRAKMRKLFEDTATLQSKVLKDKETEGIKYKDYFDFSEPIHKVPSHRILAVLRGFLEGFLRMAIAPEEEKALVVIENAYVRPMQPSADHIRKAAKDAYRRLLQPSLESEFRTALKQKADEESINVFAENLRQLLLSPPLGTKRILAIDPGYRSGCKVVCLAENGELKKTDLIYIHENGRLPESEHTIRGLVKNYQIEAIAIGDGTAGRETEQFIKKMNLGIPVFLVNEDGASVYSASETAREEFPEYDLTIRGSVSIGRRLMDPLAELVKIDPKSIGVGQYQHDVNPFRLKEKLDQTVVSCVNGVGVNLNTASKHLLGYVSGIGTSLAENIIAYRNENGGFTSRAQLLHVPRLGGKAFEQCAGFLRIKNGENPLDMSAVHPETYALVQQMADELGVAVAALVGNDALVKTIDAQKYVTEKFGLITIKDILSELVKPGLDPRNELEEFSFADIFSMEDLKTGMEVPGMVTNLTRFGAFIDIGVKQDGLVHVSEIAHKYIADPGEVLKLGQKVKVKVLEVDVPRKRIALSIKQTEEKPAGNRSPGSAHKFSPKAKQLPVESSVEDALQLLKKRFGK